MKHVSALAILVGCLAIAGQVLAGRTSTRLTREKTSDQLFSFTIKVERVKQKGTGETFEFHVKVKSENSGGHIKDARLSGYLEVLNGTTQELISSCHVQSTGRDGELSFSFRVAAKYAEQSKFVFGEADPTMAERGHGNYYWFYLKDFVESK
jgi:hypothetical protein